jgi:hypothetical protein
LASTFQRGAQIEALFEPMPLMPVGGSAVQPAMSSETAIIAANFMARRFKYERDYVRKTFATSYLTKYKAALN